MWLTPFHSKAMLAAPLAPPRKAEPRPWPGCGSRRSAAVADLSLASSGRLGDSVCGSEDPARGCFHLRDSGSAVWTGPACSDRLRRNVCASAGGVLFPSPEGALTCATDSTCQQRQKSSDENIARRRLSTPRNVRMSCVLTMSETLSALTHQPHIGKKGLVIGGK
jgi:hypothetical protein